MTMTIMPQGRQRYYDNDGVLAVGCLLYTYAAGTSTPKTAYQDSAGATPHANPIVLDAKGEAVIFWSGSYKVDIKTATGVQITGWPVDNLSAPLTPADLSAAAGSGLMGFIYATAYSAGTIGRWLKDLALSAGASFIGYASSVVGSLTRTLQSVLREDVRLLDFIPEAQHAAILAHTSTYDASDDIIAAIVAAGAVPGGANVLASRGKFKCTKPIAYANNVTITGKSKTATIFEFNNLGAGFVSVNPINSSTAANIGLRNCTVSNTNASNADGGFVDTGGTFVDLFQVKFSGFKFGTIFDQSEIATVDLCEYITPTGGSGIWLTNGADYTPLAQKLYTNRITVSRSQFNAVAGSVANILDDGGVNHSYNDNNLNAGLIGLRAANVSGLVINGNESETHGTTDFYLCDTTAAGAYVGPCVGFDISCNTPISAGAGYNIGMQNGMNGVISKNLFGQAAAAINFLGGAANQATGVVIEANSKILSGAGITAGPFVSGFGRSLRNNQIRQTAVTYVTAGQAAGTNTFTPASMEYIGVGTRIHAMNADGTNGEDTIITATTGTTATAVFASTKAALFQIYGATPQDQEEGAWPTAPTLVGAGAAGAHTYSIQAAQFSRKGNKVHVTGSIAISAKDAAMAGSMSINGLPYVSENVTNGNAVCNIALYDGFTLAGGYTHLSGIILPGTTVIALRKSGSGLALTTVPATDCPGATINLYFDAEYLTSAL